MKESFLSFSSILLINPLKYSILSIILSKRFSFWRFIYPVIKNSLEYSKYDIVINHGYQCSQPLYRKFHIDGGAIRFSFHVYNTKEDVDYIFESLSNILISTKM